jgi:hypothetical protein
MRQLGGDSGRLIVTGATAIVAGLAVGVALALADGGFSGASHSIDSPRGEARLSALMRAFRDSREAADALPPHAVEAIEASGDRQPGETPALSRIIRPAPGRVAFLWPMTDGLCYGSPGPSGCFPLDLLEQRGAVLGSRYGRTSSGVEYAHIFGIAADDVSEVRVSLDTGRTVAVPVRDNGLWAEFSTTPVRASWTFGSTQHSQERLVPEP